MGIKQETTLLEIPYRYLTTLYARRYLIIPAVNLVKSSQNRGEHPIIQSYNDGRSTTLVGNPNPKKRHKISNRPLKHLDVVHLTRRAILNGVQDVETWNELLSIALEQISFLSPIELSLVAHFFARSEIVDATKLFSSIAKQVVSSHSLSLWTPNDLIMLSGAFAKQTKQQEHLFHAIALRVIQDMHSYTGTQLTLILVYFSKVGLEHPAFLDGIQQNLIEWLPGLHAATLCQIAFAFSSFKRYPLDLFLNLATYLEGCFSEFKCVTYAKTCYAFCRALVYWREQCLVTSLSPSDAPLPKDIHTISTFILNLCDQVVLNMLHERFAPQSIGMIANSLCYSRLGCGTIWIALRDSCNDQVSNFDLQSLALVISACVRMGYGSTEFLEKHVASLGAHFMNSFNSHTSASCSIASSSTDKGNSSIGCISRLNDCVSHSIDSASHSIESASRSTNCVSHLIESTSNSNDCVSRSIESASRSNDSVSRSIESASRSNDCVSRSNDCVSRSIESASRSNDCVSRSIDGASRSTDCSSRSIESSSCSNDCDNRSIDGDSRSIDGASDLNSSNKSSNFSNNSNNPMPCGNNRHSDKNSLNPSLSHYYSNSDKNSFSPMLSNGPSILINNNCNPSLNKNSFNPMQNDNYSDSVKNSLNPMLSDNYSKSVKNSHNHMLRENYCNSDKNSLNPMLTNDSSNLIKNSTNPMLSENYSNSDKNSQNPMLCHNNRNSVKNSQNPTLGFDPRNLSINSINPMLSNKYCKLDKSTNYPTLISNHSNESNNHHNTMSSNNSISSILSDKYSNSDKNLLNPMSSSKHIMSCSNNSKPTLINDRRNEKKALADPKYSNNVLIDSQKIRPISVKILLDAYSRICSNSKKCVPLYTSMCSYVEKRIHLFPPEMLCYVLRSLSVLHASPSCTIYLHSKILSIFRLGGSYLQGRVNEGRLSISSISALLLALSRLRSFSDCLLLELYQELDVRRAEVEGEHLMALARLATKLDGHKEKFWMLVDSLAEHILSKSSTESAKKERPAFSLNELTRILTYYAKSCRIPPLELIRVTPLAIMHAGTELRIEKGELICSQLLQLLETVATLDLHVSLNPFILYTMHQVVDQSLSYLRNHLNTNSISTSVGMDKNEPDSTLNLQGASPFPFKNFSTRILGSLACVPTLLYYPISMCPAIPCNKLTKNSNPIKTFEFNETTSIFLLFLSVVNGIFDPLILEEIRAFKEQSMTKVQRVKKILIFLVGSHAYGMMDITSRAFLNTKWDMCSARTRFVLKSQGNIDASQYPRIPFSDSPQLDLKMNVSLQGIMNNLGYDLHSERIMLFDVDTLVESNGLEIRNDEAT